MAVGRDGEARNWDAASGRCRRPRLALPAISSRRGPGHALPPHVAAGVSATLVKMCRFSPRHAVGVGFVRSAGRRRMRRFRVDRVRAGRPRALDPGDVLAMVGLSSLSALPRISMARLVLPQALGMPPRCNASCRRGWMPGQHVFASQPCSFACVSNAQRETLLASSALPRSRCERPDLPGLGEMHDVLCSLLLADHVLLAGASGAPIVCSPARNSRSGPARRAPCGRCAS